MEYNAISYNYNKTLLVSQDQKYFSTYKEIIFQVNI